MRDVTDDLVRIMERIAGGEYGSDLFRYSTEEHPEMIRRIAEAMGMMMVKVEAREQRILMDLEELRERHEVFKKAVTTFVLAMSSAIGARDPYTQGHEQRTAGYALRLARRVGLSKEDAQFVYLGAMLHDIGKLGFSDRLFSGEDCRDSPELLQAIKSHPEIGSSILHWIDFLGPAVDVVRHHHERMDGSGYPQGLAGEDISYFARIVAVADTFDAITTDRPYQPGKTMHEGLETLKNIAGTHLDPALVAAFQEEILENDLE
ncbi:HD-GYP domain-containing protein [Desulfonatronum lacustre]|uniref:HD-GYP domain-containing protein n=1 Tax=Desulfonatronum lacustre TaxID=66849 RepID=UPI00048F2567|nr:HD domain-containing phosphohydrolase [Desulfonatronum lacustre]